MAQFCTFPGFATPPGSLRHSHNFWLLSESVWWKIACKKYAHTHSVISIDIFRKCDIMYYNIECEKGVIYGYRMYKKVA